jgi:hypothetical protein
MRPSQLPQIPNLLLLALLAALCCYTILCSLVALAPVDGEAIIIALTKANYAGFVAVAACVWSYFFARQLFKRALGLTLLLSIFHLVNVLPTSFNVGIGFGELHVGIEPFSFLALVSDYFLNRASANAFIRNHLLPAPTPAKAAHLHREAIDQFKQNFARKTDTSLRQLLHDPKLVPAAATAAHELLQERNAALAQHLPKN